MEEGIAAMAEGVVTKGLDGALLGLLSVVFYQLMKVTQEHRREYGELLGQMFEVVGKNTESHTKLCDTIQGLKEEIRYKGK